MITMWALVVVGVVGGLIAIVTTWHRGHAPEHLGSVSDQWLSEHRLGATQDSRR
jgi:hypothetical protein